MQPAQLEVELSFFPLMWILYLVSPWLSINGTAQRQKWGTLHLTLPAGRYQVEAWFPYIFSSQTSKGGIVVDLAPGGSYKLRYRPAWIVMLPGSMKLVGQPMLPAATVHQLPPS
jgi:hypothetical protein